MQPDIIDLHEQREAEERQFRRDLDSLYVLPLRILPLHTPALLRAKMVKDSGLKSAIEIFSDRATGTGLVYVDDLKGETFGVSNQAFQGDQIMVESLGRLNSFDVYSLRICLRQLEIEVESDAYLNLSDEKKRELADHMTAFTMPLIKQVYGTTEINAADSGDIIKMFSDPDVEVAMQKLRMLSEVLDIELHDIPKFLEDFSDIYLSLAYYQQYLDDITPKIITFIDEMLMLKTNWQLRQDPRLMHLCDVLESTLNDLVVSVTGRFEAFNRNTDKMWENISAERFRKVEALIKAHHATIGGILCGLGSKMHAWRAIFPDAEAGGPIRRSEVIMSDIVPGLDKITKIDRASPLKLEH
jgi:hypothetical protein